jgi:FMN phosphatase YigB (HAD superfamily)
VTGPAVGRAFRVVSVDLWDTVLTVGDRAAATAWRLIEFTRVLAEFGHHLPEQDLAAAVGSVLDEHARRQRHTGWQSSPADQVSDILSKLNIPTAPQLLELLVVVHSHARLRACPEPVPGALPALTRLRSAGHTLVLSSNTLTCPGTVSRRILDDHELTDLFDHLCFSDQIGVAKPHPDFFAAVAAAAAAAGSDILHIGDDWRIDVEGAIHAGCSAAWFNPARKPRPTTASAAAELSDIAALPELAAGHLPIPAQRVPTATPEPVVEA